METRLGMLEFKDGASSVATVEKIYDNLDFTHALNVFLNAYQGASTYIAREGNRSIGAADGSTVVYIGPQQPQGVTAGNWIQTMPGKGWFVILRLYSPLQSFFDKSWRPSEIEEVQ